MSAKTMHDGQLPVDADVVRRLVATQFPQWVDVAIEPFDSDGTANAIFRLGDQLVARMPLVVSPSKIEQLRKEQTWLPRFAPRLPLELPACVAKGTATDEFPSPWSICKWIDGTNATLAQLDDPIDAAVTLAEFVRALQAIDASSGPAPGAHNFNRGVPLAIREDATREAIRLSEGLVDTAAVSRAWETDLRAPVWDAAPVWLHGDLAPGNLLARDGRFVAVIDWGGLGVGDPAIELLPAWNLFTGKSRAAYRDALGVDDATWARGRGLALSAAIVGLPYYLETNPAMARSARGMIEQVLDDHAL